MSCLLNGNLVLTYYDYDQENIQTSHQII